MQQWFQNWATLGWFCKPEKKLKSCLKLLSRLRLLPFAMNNLIARLKQLYARFFDLVSYLQSPFLLLVRLYWGWQLIESGWGKLHHLDKVTDFFTSLNLPMPAQTALAISCLEFFGGIFLAAGLALAAYRAGADDQHADGVYHRGSRGAVFDLLGSGQVLCRGAVYVSDRFVARF